MDNYDDIINLPHHTSKVHKRMSMHSRAAQFAPFAALTGHNDAINETARLTETFSEPSDAEKASLDRKIGYLKNTLYERAAVSITYFVPDKRKAGGLYKKTVGAIKSIDSHEGIITMVDGTRIYTQHIRYIDGTFSEE
jgi:hypothetical protein